MTGFGRATGHDNNVLITVEIRAVNARQADARAKVPPAYRDEEPALRLLLQQSSVRGKVDAVVERRSVSGVPAEAGVNVALYGELKRQLLLAEPAFAADPVALATAVLRLPNLVGAAEAEPGASEVALLHVVFAEALEAFVGFRQNEGQALADDVAAHVQAIQSAIPDLEAFEERRQSEMRERLTRLVDEKLTGSAIDRNRLEQEVLFYLEKMDISEEKARLRQHCTFFAESLADGDLEKGRRLGFIAQEMGREINTLGAKANSSAIQRVVVGMKDELEKVKEQLANAL